MGAYLGYRFSLDTARRSAQREWRKSQVAGFLDLANRRLGYHADFVMGVQSNLDSLAQLDPEFHAAIHVVHDDAFRRRQKRSIAADNALGRKLDRLRESGLSLATFAGAESEYQALRSAIVDLNKAVEEYTFKE